jgi:uncharacterized protein YndB with AHSA1/START domain
VERDERRRVRRTLEIEADPPRVWAMIGDLEALGSWLGAEVRLPCPLRAGDLGTFVFPGGRVRSAQVETVAPGRRLAWRWSDDGLAWSVVTLLLDEVAGGRTLLTVTEESEESYGRPMAPLGFAPARRTPEAAAGRGAR